MYSPLEEKRKKPPFLEIIILSIPWGLFLGPTGYSIISISMWIVSPDITKVMIDSIFSGGFNLGAFFRMEFLSFIFAFIIYYSIEDEKLNRK